MGVLESLTSVFDFRKVLDSVRKLPSHLWLALALGSGFVLFVPPWLASRIGVEGLLASYRAWFGACLIGSTTVLLSKVLALAGRLVTELWGRWRVRQEFRFLATDQKQLLLRYVTEDTCTLKFELQDGVAGSLLVLGFLYRPTSMGNLLSGFAFNIRPWVREYLIKHPEVLGDVEPEARRRSSSRI